MQGGFRWADSQSGLERERAVVERTAEIEAGGSGKLQGAAEVGGEGCDIPNGGFCQKAGQEGLPPGPAECADSSGFDGSVGEPLAGEGRFDFEDGADAIHREMQGGGVGEKRWSEEMVVDGDVDLAGAVAFGIIDKTGGGTVAGGEMSVEEIDPVLLDCSAGGRGVFYERG